MLLIVSVKKEVSVEGLSNLCTLSCLAFKDIGLIIKSVLQIFDVRTYDIRLYTFQVRNDIHMSEIYLRDVFPYIF